jgi:hypothetical protein
VAVTIYHGFKYLQFTNSVDVLSDILKVMLVNDYVVVPNHEFVSDVQVDEASGTGYTAGGKVLAGRTLTAVAPIILDADNVEWPMSSITATGAILYKDTGDPATSPLIAYYPYTSVKISTDGEFLHEWSASGILKIA